MSLVSPGAISRRETPRTKVPPLHPEERALSDLRAFARHHFRSHMLPQGSTGATLIKTWNYCQPFHSTPASALFLCLLQAHPAWSSVETQQHLANKHTAMARSQPSLLPVCEVPPPRPVPGHDGHSARRTARENGHALWERAETGGLCEPSCGLLLRFVQTQGFSEGLLLPFRV